MSSDLVYLIDDTIDLINYNDDLFKIKIDENFKDYFTSKNKIYKDLNIYINIIKQLNEYEYSLIAKTGIQDIISSIINKIYNCYDLYKDTYYEYEDYNDIIQNLNVTENDLNFVIIKFKLILYELCDITEISFSI